jgi:nucleoside-diphosphate-sugar epimerase
MRAFVTGSTGFLGIHLLQELERDGWEIFAFHRPSSDLTELRKIGGITYVVGDVTDRASLEAGMPEGLDAVFHAAGSVGFLKPGEEKKQTDINQVGARNLAEVALKKRPRRFIYTSTVLTYSFAGGKQITENSPPNTDESDSYAHSKYLAELEIEKGAAQGLDVVFLHPSAIFGAYDKQTWSKMFTVIQEGGFKTWLAPPGKATICHMRKVAQAHISAYHHGRKGEHYLLGDVDATFLEIAGMIAEILERPAPFASPPAPLFRLFGRLECRVSMTLGKEPTLTPAMADTLCQTIVCDSSKARRELLYDPSSLRTMLMDCYQWMVDSKMLPAKSAVRPS